MNEPIGGVLYEDGYSFQHGKMEFRPDGTVHHVTWRPGEHISYDSDGYGHAWGHHWTDHITGERIDLPPDWTPGM